MFSVQKVSCTDFRDIIDALNDFWGEENDERWMKLFDYRWQRDENYCGLALKDGDRTVGFLGMIFSQRRINGKKEKFCNLTSWFVREEYRSRAISLVLPLKAMKDYTITDLTPAKTVYKVQNKLGFKDLDEGGRILLPFGRRLNAPRHLSIRMTHLESEIRQKLSAEHLEIFNDHLDYQCSHFLLTKENRYCYIVYSKHKRKKKPFIYIHYISNTDLFEHAYHKIRKAIFAHSKSYFAVIDSRLVTHLKLPFSFCLPYRAPKQYLSSRLKPAQIDNLYSELVLLNLRNHPRLKYLIRDLRRKIFGSQ